MSTVLDDFCGYCKRYWEHDPSKGRYVLLEDGRRRMAARRHDGMTERHNDELTEWWKDILGEDWES
jgi:hypothetical protein